MSLDDSLAPSPPDSGLCARCGHASRQHWVGNPGGCEAAFCPCALYVPAKETAVKAPAGVKQEHYDLASRDASLGVGHVWTKVECPAYQSYDPAHCRCGVIRVTIEMTLEEAEALVYVTAADHPGILSLTRKLRAWAERHPVIERRKEAQRQEAVESHEAMISRTASTGLIYASCACGWRSRDFRALTNAENALAAHRRKVER